MSDEPIPTVTVYRADGFSMNVNAHEIERYKADGFSESPPKKEEPPPEEPVKPRASKRASSADA